ncbi:hypothetical protein V6N13_102528 [Hibiscus sabdariffa]|uniref:Uncharacterized protein n=1 Tax=Hibiscus sabdariffa TaxID=183260 RepID=A0ABR2D4B5_9ROSI
MQSKQATEGVQVPISQGQDNAGEECCPMLTCRLTLGNPDLSVFCLSSPFPYAWRRAFLVTTTSTQAQLSSAQSGCPNARRNMEIEIKGRNQVAAAYIQKDVNQLYILF